MAVETALLEAVLEERRHQRLDVGQGRDALPEVAGGQDPVLGAQLARAAAVVCHGDDGGQVAGVLLQPPKHGGAAGTAPQRDHPWSPLQETVVVDDLGEGPVPAGQEWHADRLGELLQGKTDYWKS